jgi:CRP-like cAMP-binding protein
MEFYPKGTFIQYQGGVAPDFVYVIKKGAVKVSIENENEEVFVD